MDEPMPGSRQLKAVDSHEYAYFSFGSNYPISQDINKHVS